MNSRGWYQGTLIFVVFLKKELHGRGGLGRGRLLELALATVTQAMKQTWMISVVRPRQELTLGAISRSSAYQARCRCLFVNGPSVQLLATPDQHAQNSKPSAAAMVCTVAERRLKLHVRYSGSCQVFQSLCAHMYFHGITWIHSTAGSIVRLRSHFSSPCYQCSHDAYLQVHKAIHAIYIVRFKDRASSTKRKM